MADISKIQILNGDTYNIKDATALHGTGLETTTVGSATTGTSISADDITNWNSPASVTFTLALNTTSRSNGISTTDYALTLPINIVTSANAASLDYTSRSIPNISVTNKTVVTGITAS